MISVEETYYTDMTSAEIRREYYQNFLDTMDPSHINGLDDIEHFLL